MSAVSVDLLSNQSASSGGGAYVIGELTMDHSIISGNSSSNTGGTKVVGAVMDSSLLSTNSSDETVEVSMVWYLDRPIPR